METLGDMKLYSFDEILDEHFGKLGTPRRDELETQVDEAVNAYRIGEAISYGSKRRNA